MIDGVIIKPLVAHPDIPDMAGEESSGFLLEVVRSDENLLKNFGQSIFTVSHRKGTIKAFHWHEQQDDVWFVATGKVRVVLYDRRPDSTTKGETHVISAGTDDYKVIVIPVGVAHGYQVLTDEPVMLFYHVTEPYNPAHPDEQRLSPHDAEINFDWTLPTS